MITAIAHIKDSTVWNLAPGSMDQFHRLTDVIGKTVRAGGRLATAKAVFVDEDEPQRIKLVVAPR